MNELQELRKKVENHDYRGALAIINELEEMSLEDKLNKTNKRRRAVGYYASEESLREIINEAYDRAFKEASYEAFEGKIDMLELAQINRETIEKKAIALILSI